MKKLQNYILSTIDGDNYNKELEGKTQKIRFVLDCFKSEFLHSNNSNQYKLNPSKVLGEWLRGLPSSINIVFYNYDILNLAVLLDLIPANTNEEEEFKFLNGWFELIASEILNMESKPK
tara:strand:+ start:419 stop:775 length:357 start_codon:yes stop_codon:yes gene_type:complete